MTNFAEELRRLTDEWREKGETDDSIITALKDELESLQDMSDD